MPTLKEIEDSLKDLLDNNADDETETHQFANRLVDGFVSYLNEGGGEAVARLDDDDATEDFKTELARGTTPVLAMSAHTVLIPMGGRTFAFPLKVGKMRPRPNIKETRYWGIWFGDDKLLFFSKDMSDELIRSTAITISSRVQHVIRQSVAPGNR